MIWSYSRNKKKISLVGLEGNNEEEINMIKELIEKYARGFSFDSEPLPTTHLITHKIKISIEKSIKTIQYHYSLKLKERLQKEVDKLM
jgi:hypothetical protein